MKKNLRKIINCIFTFLICLYNKNCIINATVYNFTKIYYANQINKIYTALVAARVNKTAFG